MIVNSVVEVGNEMRISSALGVSHICDRHATTWEGNLSRAVKFITRPDIIIRSSESLTP